MIAYPGNPTKDLVIEVWVLDGVSLTAQDMWKKLVVVGPLQPNIQGTPTNFWNAKELLIISQEGYASSICTQIGKIVLSSESRILLSENGFAYTPRAYSMRPEID